MTNKGAVFIPIERTRTEYVTKQVNITEQRAPTDQSVALLKEMEAAARAKIEDSFVLSDNGFECQIYVERDVQTMARKAVAIYTLNRKKMRSYVEIRDHEIPKTLGPMELRQEFFNRVRDQMAKDIATQVLAPAYIEMADRIT